MSITVSVDIVVFGLAPDLGSLNVLLIRRGTEPFLGCLALPGGRVEEVESTETAAQRELLEEAGISPNYLEQLYTFSEPDRDPRGRVLSVAYYGLVSSEVFKPTAGSDASEANWVPLGEALRSELAFDHKIILEKSVERLRGKLVYAPIGFDLLPKSFSISDLRQLYELILGRPLNGSNFRKRVLALGILTPTGEERTGQHRPAPLYRFDKRAYDQAVRSGDGLW